MTDPQRTARDPAALVTGAIAAQVIGGLVTQMSPFVVSGLMSSHSLSERDAGFIASIELLSLAITAIAIAPVLPRFSWRRVAHLAAVLTLLTQAASIFSASPLSFALLRGLAGVGEGALYGVSLSVVASRCHNPERVYGYFQVVWALGSVALFFAGGELTAAFGLRGVLALCAALTLVLAPLLQLVPDARAQAAEGATLDPADGSSSLGVMTLGAIVSYLTASAALYMFSAPLGERAGLGTREVGYALMAASLLGLAGAAGAAALHVRWGRALPITAFCSAFALAALGLCLSRHVVGYVSSLVGSVIVYYFSIPYLFGLAAALDRRGRWATAAGSAYLLGFAAGPVVGGAVITGVGYGGLAAVSLAITAAVWALALLVNRRLNAEAHARPEPLTEA